jgi:hypothetical protein
VPAGRANYIRGDPGGHASAPRQWQAGTMTGAGEEKLRTPEEETLLFPLWPRLSSGVDRMKVKASMACVRLGYDVGVRKSRTVALHRQIKQEIKQSIHLFCCHTRQRINFLAAMDVTSYVS